MHTTNCYQYHQNSIAIKYRFMNIQTVFDMVYLDLCKAFILLLYHTL